jgi:hypothetical protein
MKRLFLAIAFLLLSQLAFGQCGANQTPILCLNIPAHGTTNWDVLLNANSSLLESYLTGQTALPSNLIVSGNFTVLGACNGCGNGTLTGSGAANQVGVFNGGANIVSYANFTSDSLGNVSVNSISITGAGASLFTVTEHTTGTLPACSGTKYFSFVSDSNSSTYGATFSGGGSTHTPVYCNGTSWTVH